MRVVCEKATEKHKIDKDVASEIQMQFKADPEL